MPMLAVVIAIIWTMGLISLLGYELTMITNVIPVILLAVGSAYAIHVINRFNREVASDPRQALLQSLVYVITPVFLASLTTVVGFLSFIAGSYLTMIMEFGLFTAIGIIFSLIMAVVFIPALLAVSGKKMQQNPKAEGKNRLFDGITSKINQLVTTSPKRIMWAWYLLILISLWGISRIERRVDLVDYFRKDNIVQQSEKLLKEKFNGSMPLYVKISGDIQSPEGLRLMKETQAFMQQFDYIPYSQSVADLIEQMNDVMGEGAVIPNEKAKIEQLWFLLDGQEIMEQMVNFDLTEALIQGSVATTGLHVLREIEINFEAFARKHSGPDFQMEVTGIPIMFKKLDDSIIKSQVYSLIIAMLLVVGIISLLQRSLIKGLMTIIPVFATLITLFGLMGLTGIPLDIATVLTGSVTIGIGIDYAIHFMTHFGSAYQQGKSIAESISSTLNISGRAILINMFSVTIGFAVLLFSNLVPLQRFGFLIAATMLISAMAALTLLPAVLLLTGDRLKQIFQIAENLKNNLNNHKHKQKIPKNG
jgi:predicted RND superfamily exporter protein